MSPAEKTPLQILRERRGTEVQRLNQIRQEQVRLQKALLAAIETEAKTVPQLAMELQIPSKDVFWHLMALKKYNRVVEGQKKGDYVEYRKKN